MKFAAVIDYRPDAPALDAGRAAHRVYLRELLDSGRLAAAGPLADAAGAVWVFDADDATAAERLVAGDPYCAAGVFGAWRIVPLAYWSARGCKGER